MKHSPGPWKWDNDESLVAAGNHGLAIYFEPGADPTREDKANLRLIAAAPRLLEALKDALGCECGEDNAHGEQWRALVAEIGGK